MARKETDLIQELLKSVEALGLEGTKNALQSARNKSLNLSDKRIEFVLDMVSSHYNIPTDKIINSNTKSKTRILALKFAIYYLYEVFDISFTEMKSVLKRDKSLLSRSAKEIRDNSKKDNYTKQMISLFDTRVNNFKTLNNIK